MNSPSNRFGWTELELDAFDARRDHFDALVAQTPDIDGFCSSTDWVIPAHRALMPERTTRIWRSDAGYLALALAIAEDGRRFLQPLEAAWCLACPLIGADTTALARESARLLHAERESFDLALLCGLTPSTAFLSKVARALVPYFELRQGPSTVRHIADLSEGLEPYLARRSRNFRRSLARAEKRCHDAGISFENAATDAEPEALYRRILGVELRSWKGRELSGITEGGMRELYADIVARLSRRRTLEVTFARFEGKDVAYILGGRFGSSYRGLQFSFDASFERYSLGNVIQLQTMRRLEAEGVRDYDLGTDVPYKSRWADRQHETLMLVVVSGW
ncbi:MAG: GNAT family N-acetyltransferase [Myxococcota bacterium]